MPLYEYRCEGCAQLFEAYKRMTERTDEEPCPRCGAAARRVKVSLFGARGVSSGSSGKGSCGSGARRSPFG